MSIFPTGFNDVAICNMALSEIGARQSISSMLENSAEGKAVNLWYEFCRLQTLEACNWQFARKRSLLTLSAEDPPTGVWLYRYLLPSDCIAIRSLENPLGPQADAVPYALEESDLGVTTLLTNLEDAKAIYTSNVTTVSRFSPLFVSAFALRLAYQICFTITGNNNLKKDIAVQFIGTIRAAATSDQNQAVEEAPRDTDWIAIRDGFENRNCR